MKLFIVFLISPYAALILLLKNRFRPFGNQPKTPSTTGWQKILPMVLIIQLIAMALLISYHQRSEVYDEPTPLVKMESSQAHGDYHLTITCIDLRDMNISTVSWTLLDEYGMAVHGEQGNVRGIHQTDMDTIFGNATFRDNDENGYLSRGDTFIIKGVGNGGKTEEGYRLLLKSDITGDKMNGRGTILG
jgi:hypothetical protein